MAARRGKKQARRSGGSASMPGWVWLLVGMMISAVVGFAVYFKLSQPDNGLPKPNPAAKASKSSNTGVAPEGSAAAVPDATKAAPKKTEYDFYTLLPNKEVIIPDEELSARVKAEAAALAASKAQATPETAAGTAPASGSLQTAGTPVAGTSSNDGVAPGASSTATNTSTASVPSGRYLLQAGAFRNPAQADDLKARIALLGLVGRVEIVQTPGGPMHRVRLGPYATASELEQAKQTLGNGGLPAVAIRVK